MENTHHSAGANNPKEAWVPVITYPADLPITGRREEIIKLIRDHSVVIVAGETGSGKTTQLPKLCLEAGLGVKGKIGCTQPRRVAAYSVADRIAEELKVRMGDEVGCKVRFDDRTNKSTRIQVMTDGILLAEVQSDPLLRAYEAIIIDEAHERSLNIDFLIGYLRQLKTKRRDLKIILTSATIDTARFSEAFDGAPVISIEGRTYPVDVIYSPVEANEDGEGSYIEAAVEAVKIICLDGKPGDVLIFLPGERDIRELSGVLEETALGKATILPLFGRLSQIEQHRIFAPTQSRKIILATNIAETSLTIPGIRYVIDTGLVRISRYSPHTRTQRLPIEPHSQSSAKQRQGRAGRVAEGICIRLYDEKDLLARDEYTEPEIRRCNLAEVILRMIAFRLGDIESFPFLEPPEERAVKAGYKLLKDLGALDGVGTLTPIGEQLARLPVDPTVGRMLIEARKEHATTEVLIIAAALSIQDPRERPFEFQDKADACHRRFIHPESDFLTLLNIWKAYHGACEKMSQRVLRRFCKEHYLSYIRMREWRDVHQQLALALKDLNLFRDSELEADYRAIHRCLLVGLLGNVAEKEKGNYYKGTHNRKVMLFPGSGLFDRREKREKAQGAPNPTKDTSKTPLWMMCGEWMETTQLFARTVAKIEPEWAAELGAHMVKRSYTEPFWEPKRGRVLIKEKVYLHGLLLQTNTVGYGAIDADKACELFIREALVGDTVLERFKFLDHNRQLREAVEDQQIRLRLPGAWATPDLLFKFYAERIEGISSVAELFQRVRGKGDQDLLATEADLIDPDLFRENERAYPKTVDIGGTVHALHYHYEPGSPEDGVTLSLDLEHFPSLKPDVLDWLVPGYREAHVQELLRLLPKEARRNLFPIADTASKIAGALKPGQGSFKATLKDYLWEHYKVRVMASDWDQAETSDYLRPRVAVKARDRLLAVSRCWEELESILHEELKLLKVTMHETDKGKQLWSAACKRLEQEAVYDWTFGDIPREIPLGTLEGVAIIAYPGLECIKGMIALRLFRTELEAQRASVEGYRALLNETLMEDFKVFQKDLNVLQRLAAAYVTLGSLAELKESVYAAIKRHFVQIIIPWPMKEQGFRDRVKAASVELRGLPLRTVDNLSKVLVLRQEMAQTRRLPADLFQELNRLIYPGFLRYTPYPQWVHLERYLKALKLRAERRALNPAKDNERWRLIAPWVSTYERFKDDPELGPAQLRELEAYRWLVEEYKVSIFAQELGTPEPVSAKRIQEALERVDLVR